VHGPCHISWRHCETQGEATQEILRPAQAFIWVASPAVPRNNGGGVSATLWAGLWLFGGYRIRRLFSSASLAAHSATTLRHRAAAVSDWTALGWIALFHSPNAMHRNVVHRMVKKIVKAFAEHWPRICVLLW
tara:strand:+ start:89 stop:484 length:396 start_codon:yes stop_codon:yes gene_type:complete